MQKLGTVTFLFNPDRQSIPLKKKSVASVGTYTSSAIFQWSPIWEGSSISLEWDFMPSAQYEDLVDLYLSTDAIEFDADNGGDKFQVIVTDLTGDYFEVAGHGLAYRKNVRIQLEIRSYTYDPPN